MNAIKFSIDEIEDVAKKLGIRWSDVQFDLDQFARGMAIELEHGTRDLETNVTNNDTILTGKIALAHLREFPDYYTRLDVLEKEAEAFWEDKK